jgi:hypothetical protein
MQFWGDHDPITPTSDVQQFQTEYGGDSSVTVLSGSGHIPFYSSAKDTFWKDTFKFLDKGGDCWDHGWKDGCGEDVDDSTVSECGAPSQQTVTSSKQSCMSW